MGLVQTLEFQNTQRSEDCFSFSALAHNLRVSGSIDLIFGMSKNVLGDIPKMRSKQVLGDGDMPKMRFVDNLQPTLKLDMSQPLLNSNPQKSPTCKISGHFVHWGQLYGTPVQESGLCHPLLLYKSCD